MNQVFNRNVNLQNQKRILRSLISEKIRCTLSEDNYCSIYQRRTKSTWLKGIWFMLFRTNSHNFLNCRIANEPIVYLFLLSTHLRIDVIFLKFKSLTYKWLWWLYATHRYYNYEYNWIFMRFQFLPSVVIEKNKVGCIVSGFTVTQSQDYSNVKNIYNSLLDGENIFSEICVCACIYDLSHFCFASWLRYNHYE